MISVIIPLYNKEKFISEAVQSVLKQTFTDFELIIVDDGSTDKSLKIAQSFNDQRLKLISIENSGVSIARNTGIKDAKYDWIALLDADDWWASTFLEEMIHAVSTFPKYKLFAGGRSRVFNEQIERYQHEFLPKDGVTGVINYFKVISKYLPLINSSNTVINKTIFKEKGFFREGQKKHEDHDLWMRLCIQEEIVFVNKNLSFYRKTESDTASMTLYSADDFCMFLSTMIAVKKDISDQEGIYFEQYYNRYCLLVYFQYYGQYTKNENKKVFNLLKLLLVGKFLWFAKIIKILPLKALYPFYKKMKR